MTKTLTMFLDDKNEVVIKDQIKNTILGDVQSTVLECSLKIKEEFVLVPSESMSLEEAITLLKGSQEKIQGVASLCKTALEELESLKIS